MRWFDDLWLKEGFAQYMAYKTLAALRPNDDIWQHFYQSIKPAAYAIDETQGTTPIYQEIRNLDSAKSAYGAIVYSKAPGVLRQLNYVIGDDAFRRGLQLYLAQHKYSNATWSDLIAAFQSASGRDLTAVGRYVDSPSRHAPHRRFIHLLQLTSGVAPLTQTPLLGGNELWPIATEVLLAYPDGSTQTLRAELNSRIGLRSSVPVRRWRPALPRVDLPQQRRPRLRPLPPRRQIPRRRHASKSPPTVRPCSDLFRRTLLWGSLWDSVRQVELDPADYVRLALDALPSERDEVTGRESPRPHPNRHPPLRRRIEPSPNCSPAPQPSPPIACSSDPSHDLRIVWFRSLAGFAAQPAGQAVLKNLLQEKRAIPGVDLRQQDRWSLVTALIAYADPDADALFAAEQKRDPSGDGLKFAWVAQAARPDAATKQHYFAEYPATPQARNRPSPPKSVKTGSSPPSAPSITGISHS